MTYHSTKTYGHEIGLSCAFRQWRAQSHCQLIHGYALSFKFTFEAEELDEKNWVADFGNFKELKSQLENIFDHTLVIAYDDPKGAILATLGTIEGLARVVRMDEVGCEAFAELAYSIASDLIERTYGCRVQVVSCECAEHGANSAIYIREK